MTQYRYCIREKTKTFKDVINKKSFIIHFGNVKLMQYGDVLWNMKPFLPLNNLFLSMISWIDQWCDICKFQIYDNFKFEFSCSCKLNRISKLEYIFKKLQHIINVNTENGYKNDKLWMIWKINFHQENRTI